VSARQAELEAAAADVDRAMAAYLPRLTLTGRYTRLSKTDSSSAESIVAAPGAPAGPIAPGTPLVNVPLQFRTLQNQYTVQANLTVPLSDYFFRIRDAHGTARQRYAAARQSVAAAELDAGLDAKLAFYAWVRARLGQDVANRALQQSRAHLADARAALEVGSASQADLLRVESQVAKSELLVETSKKLTHVAETELRLMLQDPKGVHYRLGEDLGRPPPPLPHESEAKLWSRALAARPEIRALDASERAATRNASVERAGAYPRFDLFANAYYANPNPRSFPQRDEFSAFWDAGAQVTWVLSDIPGSSSGVSAASARARRIAAERRAAEDAIRAEVTRALADAREADVAIRTTARGLRSARESYRVRRVLFQNNKATSVELIDAETDLTRARLDALNASVSARVARAELAHALGEAVRPSP
jgi:outer membrane protein TolC